ncbi:hypothetical protein LBMAG53_17780 [Planctomycetota bacterium]|nr:hypothetical protein LBMAG53_17780 [Planctomycetota bacterium]
MPPNSSTAVVGAVITAIVLANGKNAVAAAVAVPSVATLDVVKPIPGPSSSRMVRFSTVRPVINVPRSVLVSVSVAVVMSLPPVSSLVLPFTVLAMDILRWPAGSTTLPVATEKRDA